jgi:aminoglycoside/choline kinase family phosphotransferase
MREAEIEKEYEKVFGKGEIKITRLPASGSDRQYFRISSKDKSVICTLNPVTEENEAFIGFSRHFAGKKLPVPEILGYNPGKGIYFQSDLGDVNLFSWLREKDEIERFGKPTIDLYHIIIETLILFQTKGIEGLDPELCYPHRSFDRQSMMWDMNYFKYMFLKLLAVPFNEKRLEHDFDKLAEFLLSAGQEYFLYRDFQSANIMIVEGSPWFIDYQGGRKGAAQYDIASLLFDAKVPMDSTVRDQLYNYYINRFCKDTGEDQIMFEEHGNAFIMIRLMQALGTFGFRGLYENKPTFSDSIVPGLKLLQGVAGKSGSHLDLPELFGAIDASCESAKYKQLCEAAVNLML